MKQSKTEALSLVSAALFPPPFAGEGQGGGSLHGCFQQTAAAMQSFTTGASLMTVRRPIVRRWRQHPDATVEIWAMDEHRIGLKPIVRGLWAPVGEAAGRTRPSSIWYAEFTSEYGSDLEYAFRGSSDDGFSPSDLFLRENHESVPYTINATLDDLRRYCTAPDQGLAEITERIEMEKLFGTELIRPVMEILERNVAQFNPTFGGGERRSSKP